MIKALVALFVCVASSCMAFSSNVLDHRLANFSIRSFKKSKNHNYNLYNGVVLLVNAVTASVQGLLAVRRWRGHLGRIFHGLFDTPPQRLPNYRRLINRSFSVCRVKVFFPTFNFEHHERPVLELFTWNKPSKFMQTSREPMPSKLKLPATMTARMLLTAHLHAQDFSRHGARCRPRWTLTQAIEALHVKLPSASVEASENLFKLFSSFMDTRPSSGSPCSTKQALDSQYGSSLTFWFPETLNAS
ncbi:hypothetical protein DFH08DRAFT_817911 [Mycena albidolilacea]|uniref:Uncharacterized protein n=1 Tax=Mycena albidolilacea TaxID=1033008 RepID=A0AAD6ZI95_9AGAR|nr:hypothetical protein DFH08DRAFT_817911 [Mycena albidolilacea]